MGRLLPLLFIVDLALIAVAMVDCLGCEPRDVRVLPRWLWIPLILLAPPIGPIAWLAVGRPEPVAVLRRLGRPAPRPSGPDDDPEFLHGLSGRRLRPQDEELLRRLEAEFGTPDDSRRRHPSGKDIDNDRGGDPTET